MRRQHDAAGIQPVVREVEAPALLAEDLAVVDPHVVQVDHVRVIAAGGDAGQWLDRDARVVGIDEERGEALAPALRRLILARDREQDDEIGDVRVRDELLGAVDHPVPAVAARLRGDAAGIRPGAGFGQREAFGLFAAHGRVQILLDLRTPAVQQDGGRSGHDRRESIAHVAELALAQRLGEVVEPTAADLHRQVDRIEAQFDRLAADLLHELLRDFAQPLDEVLVRHELRLDEAPQ